MERMSDFHRNALTGLLQPMTETPEAGFYRFKSGGKWVPVCFFWHEGEMWWATGDRTAELASHPDAKWAETWIACARYAVTLEDYHFARTNGHWPGGDPHDENVRAVIGGNQPPEDEASFIELVQETAAKAMAWIRGRTIVSHEEAERCEKLVVDLRGLRAKVKATHEEEKRPSLEESRRIDEKWLPLARSCDATTKAITDVLAHYLKARRDEKEAAAKEAQLAGNPVSRVNTKGSTSGVHGRKLSLRKETRAEITDWQEATLFFANDNDIRERVQRLADKCAKAGASMPWFKTITTEKAA